MVFGGLPAASLGKRCTLDCRGGSGPENRVEQVEPPQNQDSRPRGRVEHSRARAGIESSTVERKSKRRGHEKEDPVEQVERAGPPVEHSRAHEPQIPKNAKTSFGFGFAEKIVGFQRNSPKITCFHSKAVVKALNVAKWA